MFSKGVLRAIGNDIIRPTEESVAKSTEKGILNGLVPSPARKLASGVELGSEAIPFFRGQTNRIDKLDYNKGLSPNSNGFFMTPNKGATDSWAGKGVVSVNADPNDIMTLDELRSLKKSAEKYFRDPKYQAELYNTNPTQAEIYDALEASDGYQELSRLTGKPFIERDGGQGTELGEVVFFPDTNPELTRRYNAELASGKNQWLAPTEDVVASEAAVPVGTKIKFNKNLSVDELNRAVETSGVNRGTANRVGSYINKRMVNKNDNALLNGENLMPVRNIPVEQASKGEGVSVPASDKLSDARLPETGLSPQQQEFFKDSVVRDENGDLKVLYHGSPNGEFYEFNKELANPEGDWGKGFYFTDNELDVKNNYVGGGPDFDNKVARRAEQLEDELDIPYEKAEEQARKELLKGDYQISAYSNMKEPAIVGKTSLFDGSEYGVKPLEDYDNIDDYYQDLIYDLSDDVISDTNIDYAYKDDLMRIMSEAYYDGGVGLQELKDKLNELYIEDYDGNLVGNDVARSIIENLGFDGIIDPTVSSKFNMDIADGTTHYIMFNPEQVKNVGNRVPTKSKDIRYAIAAGLGLGSIIGPYMNSQKSVDNIK